MDEVMGSSDIRSVLYHYVRIKISNDRGREQQSTIDIPYAGDPDSECRWTDAMPSVEPGSIIEYRWTARDRQRRMRRRKAASICK